MGKFRTFFITLYKSFFSPAYYTEILKAKFSFSLKYFLVFFLFYSLIGTALLSISAVPPVSAFLRVLPQKIASLYPPELEIYFKNGEASANVRQPYAIPFSRLEDAFSQKVLAAATPGDIMNLLVIDTASGSAENFKSYQTAALLTKTSLISQNKQGQLKVYPFESNMNFVINQALVSRITSKITPYIKYVVPIMIAGIFLFLLLIPASYFQLYLLFFAFALWLFSKIVKPQLTYSQSFRLGMHLCTITITLFSLLTLARINLSFPFLQTILLLIYSYFILAHLKKTGPPIAVSPPATPMAETASSV